MLEWPLVSEQPQRQIDKREQPIVVHGGESLREIH